ncbi:MAG TPA: arylamine N-acetyltransferase [Acetobacteraceae bacterium]|nr:arylamine N-acetyltransferase [Acetobacteraceae bacterium]
MSSEPFDLDAYLARIGYAGPRTPCWTVLASVIGCHTATIPFENIEVFLRRPVPLDVAALQRKMVWGRRGGYCYEHNILLLAALRAMGFDAEGLLARVLRGFAADADTPRTHMLLRVSLPEGLFLADSGFGNQTPTAPLAFGTEQAQPTLHEWFRLLPMQDECLLQARLGEAWENVYRLSTQRTAPIDYEVANWFVSTRPGGLFVDNLVIARQGPGRRVTLFNGRLTVRDMQGDIDQQMITEEGPLTAALADYFGLTLASTDIAALATAMRRRQENPDAHPHFG